MKYNEYSTADFTVAKVELDNGKQFFIASCYMTHSREAPPNEVWSAMGAIHPLNTIIIGCDANARHSLWGSTETSDREKATSIKCFRNPKRTNWEKFNRVLRDKLPSIPHKYDTTAGIDKAVSILEKSLDTAFKVSCPRTRSKMHYPPRWTSKLSKLRKQSRKAFNDSYQSGSWQPYKDKLKEYKKAIARAKKQSWIEFCGALDSTKDTARLSKFMAKGHSNPTYIKRNNGTWKFCLQRISLAALIEPAKCNPILIQI
ncbi:uncharacterized protein [Musca autumnalis]|uniref:uncharacterized protein n=1 Tax=Musca autumnalis TaxID=221902 RepID=UPI003CEB4496